MLLFSMKTSYQTIFMNNRTLCIGMTQGYCIYALGQNSFFLPIFEQWSQLQGCICPRFFNPYFKIGQFQKVVKQPHFAWSNMDYRYCTTLFGEDLEFF